VKEADALVGCNVPRGQKLEGIGLALPRVTEREEGRVPYPQEIAKLTHCKAKSLVVHSQLPGIPTWTSWSKVSGASIISLESSMKKPKRMLFVALLLSLVWAGLLKAETARVWEGTLRIPTYLLGPDDPNPPFPAVNGQNIYPYTMQDDLTDRREVKSYEAVYLENEFLKATVLPELGGRLYSLYDKTDKREVFYRNNVVKYGLVSLRGAWISGGIEFNFPNGHTTDTVARVSYRTRENTDGSATVIIGDVDQVSEMHWEVALTLRSGEARLEERVTLFNDTPVTNLYWYWANAAVPATEDMQFIYPMREANPHSHSAIWTYPRWKGVDYSWYKNIRQPTSLFGLQVHRDFFGAYYHKQDRGVVHVADFRALPGKKIWSWGVAGDGLIWTNLLTDQDGPYNEIQSGRFETQLSQEFMTPGAVEQWTEYWYPVHGLEGGFVEASNQCALNVRFRPPEGKDKPRVEALVSPVVGIGAAEVKVKLGEKVLRSFKPVAFKPLVTSRFLVSVEDLNQARNELEIEIQDQQGKTVLHWDARDPVDGNRAFVSSAGDHSWPQIPDDKLTVEQLFIKAQTDEKEGRRGEAANRYRGVLMRDPGYIPALLAVALERYRAADFISAHTDATFALSRDQTNAQAAYLAGVILRREGKLDLAQDLLWKSIHFGGNAVPALAQLGEIAIQQMDYANAETLLRQALNSSPDNMTVMCDLAVSLRGEAKLAEAASVAAEAERKMPLFPPAVAEKWIIAEAASPHAARAAGVAKTWKQTLGYASQNYLEVAAWYRELNVLTSSDFVLKAAVENLPDRDVSPLIYYYLAANAWKEHRSSEAAAYAAKAAAANFTGVFPNRIEDAEVLNEAIAQDSRDTHAATMLGNFLFAHGRYDEAAQEWSQAMARGFDDPVLARNLGIYAWKVKKDLAEAGGFFEKAIRLAPHDFRLYTNLDEIYARQGATDRREKLLADAPPDVLDHDTVRASKALLLLEKRQFDEALDLLKGHNFKPWEGGRVIRDIFVAANLEKGRKALAEGNPARGERAFREALSYPVNLGVGEPDERSDEAAQFWLGEAFAAQGKAQAALEAWTASSREGASGGISLFYHALDSREMGRVQEAEDGLEQLANAPSKGRTAPEDYYLAGLAARSLKRVDEANADFQKALQLEPTLWPARLELSRPENVK
jgi:tetratricopeptide (TPR) repeat protein